MEISETIPTEVDEQGSLRMSGWQDLSIFFACACSFQDLEQTFLVMLPWCEVFVFLALLGFLFAWKLVQVYRSAK